MSNVEHEPQTPAATSPGTRKSGGDQATPTTSIRRTATYDDDQMDPQEYARLLDLYDNSFRHIAEGEVVKGTVLKVTETGVVVDVGFKSEGIIALDEFLDENRQVIVQPGDVVDVLLERTEDREGYVVLSREKAEKMKIWDEVEKAYSERKVVVGRVIERIKGGLAVDIGVRAFLPGSQIDVRPVRNLDALQGPGPADAGHQGQQEARQHRPLAQGPARGRERREEEAHARDARRGQAAARRGEEHHRLRRLHRPGRHRRPAAHHRHVVGPRRTSVRGAEGQRRDRRHRAEVRPGHRARLARPQAARGRSVVGGRRALSRSGCASAARS